MFPMLHGVVSIPWMGFYWDLIQLVPPDPLQQAGNYEKEAHKGLICSACLQHPISPAEAIAGV